MAEMEVRYVSHMGDDRLVVNSARVSMGKEVKEFRPLQDGRLLRYLAKHKHELPFAHPHVSFHFKAPIFVARQLAKHQVGFVWSEISRRYVKGSPELWWPQVWRKGSEDIKQGSLEEEFVARPGQMTRVADIVEALVWEYERLLADGCCAEQARMILPQNMMTEWVWTGSLLGWARVWGLRMGAGAQKETKDVVGLIDEKMCELFPVSWVVLKEFGPKKEVE
jgi:thymidylate synthase (FAD)